MKIVAAQFDINLALKSVAKVISKKAKSPDFADVAIEVSEGSVKLQCVGLESVKEIVATVPSTNEGSGTLYINAAAFADALSGIGKEEAVVIEYSEGVAKVAGANSGITSSVPAKTESNDRDGLAIFGGSADKAFKVQTPTLLQCLNSTIFAASDDPVKQTLTGAHFTISNNNLEVVATNGHIMPLISVRDAIETDETEDMEFTAPAKFIKEMVKVMKLKAASALTTVAFSAKVVEFQFAVGHVSFVYRMQPVPGQYPNYRQLFPSDYKNSLRANAAQVSQLFTQASKVAKGWNNVGKLTISEGNLTVTATSDSADNANSTKFSATVPVDTSNNFEIAFNCAYVLDGLKALPGKPSEFYLRCNSPTTPAIFTPVNPPQGTEFRFLVMPVQIRS